MLYCLLTSLCLFIIAGNRVALIKMLTIQFKILIQRMKNMKRRCKQEKIKNNNKGSYIALARNYFTLADF